MSADKHAAAARFRSEINAPFAFIADSDGKLIRLFGVKIPLITIAKRTTFVIGKDRKIVHIDTGRGAVDSKGAAEACQLSFG